MFNLDSELKRELIIENFNNPVNKGLKNDPSYIKGEKKNSSCIDHFTIEVKIEDDIVKDIRFDGEACAIATSSLSIAISKLIGKTKEEALNIIDNYNKMIKGEEYDNVIFAISKGWNQYQFEIYAPMIRGTVPNGKESAFVRNRNLFYVCCSRPKKRLFFFVSVPIDRAFRCFLINLVGKENILTYSEYMEKLRNQ